MSSSPRHDAQSSSPVSSPPRRVAPTRATALPTWAEQAAAQQANDYSLQVAASQQFESSGSDSDGAQNKRRKLSAEFALDADLNSRICVWQGDMTKLEVDAITNAANAGVRSDLVSLILIVLKVVSP